MLSQIQQDEYQKRGNDEFVVPKYVWRLVRIRRHLETRLTRTTDPIDSFKGVTFSVIFQDTYQQMLFSISVW